MTGSASRASGSGAGSSSSSSASSPTRPPRDNRPLLPRSPSALLFPPAPPPLHITIRFSIALPDLHLDIASPQQTTVVALKHLIRGRLAADAEAEDPTETAQQPDDDSSSSAPPRSSPAAQAALARLRFIHNGRILPDTSVLSSVLKAPPPPPLSHQSDPKGKSPAGVHYQQQRVFINCSIGEPLATADLQAEATAAAAPLPPPPASPSFPSHTSTRSATPRLAVQTTNLSSSSPSHHQHHDHRLASDHPPHHTTDNNASTPTPQVTRPQGFDRLLQAGLAPAEISTLRSHFRAIHTARFTPDTMPSPDSLRAMEDAWLDNDSGTGTHLGSTGLGAGAEAGAGLGDGYTTGGGAVDMDGEEGPGTGTGTGEDVYGLSAVAGPLIKGMLIGFVFPLGVIGWLGKEDGVWSRRMQFFVVFGVLLSVSVGLVRGLTGEG